MTGEHLLALNTEDLAPGATKDLAAFVAALTYDKIPSPVISKVKELVLDNVGVIIFGNQTPWAKMVVEMADESGAVGRSAIMGHGIKTSPALAGLVNATGGHSFEFDEIHKEAGFHPGSIVLPVVLALAECEGGCSGREVITAVVVGYEVGCRVGMSTGHGLFYRGHHPKGSTGVFAAAAAAAKILGLNETATQNALGIAGTYAAGLMAAQEGAMVKRMHAGMAAQNGIYGALLARKGFTGIQNVLEASFGGFLQTFSNTPLPRNLRTDLGKTWETLNVGYKPYATVASIHTALDGLRSIMKDNSLTADQISRIDVGRSKVTYHHCAWEYRLNGVTAAQMSLFYSMAVLAMDGDAGVDQFREDRLEDPQILDLISKFYAHIDDDIENMGRKLRHGAIVQLKTKSGQIFEKMELHRRGSPENPARAGDIERKFELLAGRVLPKDHVQCLLQRLANLEDAQSLDNLLDVLKGRR